MTASTMTEVTNPETSAGQQQKSSGTIKENQKGVIAIKHGKKPTRSQRIFITSKRLNSDNWLVVKDTTTEMVLVHKHFDGKKRIIPKGAKYDD